jgi:hypothetical protein
MGYWICCIVVLCTVVLEEMGFDVITSLVSIEYGWYGCEKVTSQSEDEMNLKLTSLQVISMVRGHVIRCFRN